MNHWDDIAIAILAGGQSTRMGRDKAELEIEGEAMLRRIARRAHSTRAPVCIVGRTRSDDWPRALTVEFVPDENPGQGPLAGLLAALSWSRRPRLLLLPCDLPLLEDSALQWIARRASTCTSRHGLATTRGKMLEPLFSMYFAQAQEHARKYLQSQRRSLHGLIESGDFERAECPPHVAAQLFNCNTPEDLEAVRSGGRGT